MSMTDVDVIASSWPEADQPIPRLCISVSVFYQIGTTQRAAASGPSGEGEAERNTENPEDASSAETCRLDLIRRGQEQEFRVGCVGVGDSMGILVASLVSMPLQLSLCSAQVARGRDLCTKV